MCEIAVVDPEKCSPAIIHQIAAKFHEEQGDGLGLLAVQPRGDEGFDYRTYKSVVPHWQTMYSFLKRNMEDTWRFVIHGRASTCGDVNRESAHPIRVDCDSCSFEYVVHNGSVRKHRNIRAGLTSQGHHFNTKVDSEVLAHKVQELPPTVEGFDGSTFSFRGNLNYLLFADEGIFVRVSKKYHLTENFTMTCSLRDFDDYEELGFERGNRTEWMLIEPGEDGPKIETETRTRRTTNTTSRTGNNYSRRASGGSVYWASDYTSEDQTYTREYTDHCVDFEHITAIKVAPGIMEVIDKEAGKSQFVYRDADPRLYYWYAPEEAPDNLQQLEELAEENPIKPGQTNLMDFASDEEDEENEGNESLPEEEVITKPTAEVVAKEEGVTMEEAAEIADEVYEKLRESEDSIQGTIGG